MASNSVTTSKYGYTLTLTAVETSTSVSDNASNISVTLTLKANGSYIQGNRMWGNIAIDGTSVASYDGSYDLPSHYGSVELKSYSGTVAHNADGTKTIKVTATLDSTDGAYPNPGEATVAVTLVLTAIPRKSEIGQVHLSDGAIEAGVSVTFAPASSTFTHRLTLLAGQTAVAVRNSYASGTTVTLTAAELLTLYRAEQTALTVQLTTLQNGKELGAVTAQVALSERGNLHIRKDGLWRRGVAYVGRSPAVVLVRQNGVWRAAK
ncbi:MAG: hypothetical protein J6R33_01075 [Clostridia bacterium]|nr:hypothetical protein [Clostridia bacterium]